MSENTDKGFGIKSWSEEDRPREKMLMKGYQALSNAELVAILLGSGSRDESAVSVAKKLLSDAGNNLNILGKYSISRITKHKGIGKAKAVSICAALELGRRRKLSEISQKTKITVSREVYDYVYNEFADLDHERFFLILLDRANQVLSKKEVSKGGVAGTIVDPKVIFKLALEELASSIILCHNHPSGNRKPSQSDIDLTKKLKKGGELLDIRILDHLIFAHHEYYSFADEGMM